VTKTKLFLVVVLLIGLASMVSAQKRPIDKKSMNLGGAFTLTTASGELYGDNSVTNISLVPSFRYFVANGLAVGVDLLFQSESSGDNTESTFGIGPVIAYFFDVKSDKVYPYVGVGIGYASISQSWSNYSTTGFQFRFGGGAAFMLKPNLALFAEAMYAIESLAYGDYDAEGGGRLMFTVGLAAFIY